MVREAIHYIYPKYNANAAKNAVFGYKIINHLQIVLVRAQNIGEGAILFIIMALATYYEVQQINAPQSLVMKMCVKPLVACAQVAITMNFFLLKQNTHAGWDCIILLLCNQAVGEIRNNGD